MAVMEPAWNLRDAVAGQFCSLFNSDIELLKSSLLLPRISPCNFDLRNTKRFCSRGLFFRAGFRWCPAPSARAP